MNRKEFGAKYPGNSLEYYNDLDALLADEKRRWWAEEHSGLLRKAVAVLRETRDELFYLVQDPTILVPFTRINEVLTEADRLKIGNDIK